MRDPLIDHDDSFGNLISVEPTCFGTCDATSSCEVVGAGTLLWCQCEPGGGTEVCVGVVTGSGLRCVNLECPSACVKQSVSWTTPKTGETHTQKWCECQ